MEFSKSLKRVLLLELLIPMLLLVLGVYLGLIQVLSRAGVIRGDSIWSLKYFEGLTLHGVVNAIVVTTFFAVAFGNAVMVYYLKNKINMTWVWVSFWVMMIGTLLAAWAIMSGNATVLYTFYAPLKAHPLFYIGVALLVVGSWIAFFNWIPMYLRFRKEHPEKKTPIAVVGTLANFVIWFIATVPVAYEVLVILLPWSLGYVSEINVMLTRVLFWFFGHPLVYFWLLPAYIMYYAFLPKLVGSKIYSDFAARLVFFLFLIFSIPVGLHHQFAEPSINPNLKLLHAVFTFGVALPSLITAFSIAASLEMGAHLRGHKGLMSWVYRQPFFDKNNYLFAYLIVGLLIFIVGGATGILNASYSMNNLVHNTGFLPGHFHLTVAGPVILAIFGMTVYMYSNLTGKEVKLKSLNVAVPYIWALGLTFFSSGLMVGGLLGEPRRTNLGISYTNPDSPLFHSDWQITTAITAIGGTIMFIAALSYFTVLIATMASKSKGSVAFSFPTSEAYHDEKNISLVKNFAPWILVAVVIILIAYVPTIKEALENTAGGALPYLPTNPVPITP